MKKFSLLQEHLFTDSKGNSYEAVNCEDLKNDSENIDWIQCVSNDIGDRKNIRLYKFNKSNISYGSLGGDMVVIFKNKDALAVISVYGLFGSEIFKDIVILYGHEQIIIYDTSDFTHKIIYTR